MAVTTRIDVVIPRIVRWGGPGAMAWLAGGVVLSVLCALLLTVGQVNAMTMYWVFLPLVVVQITACGWAARAVAEDDPLLARGWWWACGSGVLTFSGHALYGLDGGPFPAGLALLLFMGAGVVLLLALLAMVRPRPVMRERRDLLLDLLLVAMVGLAMLWRGIIGGNELSDRTILVGLAGFLPVVQLVVVWAAWWASGLRRRSARSPGVLLGLGAACYAVGDVAAFFDLLSGRSAGLVAFCSWVLGVACFPAAAAAQVLLGAAQATNTQASHPFQRSPLAVTAALALVLVLALVFFADRLPLTDLIILLALVVVVLLRILAVLQEREQLTLRIREMRDSLEARVRERTLELDRSNAGLRQEVIERRRIESAEREARATAEALQHASQAVNSSLDLEEVLDRILGVLRQALPHAAASIILVDAGVARILRRHGWEASNAFTRSSFPVSEHPGLDRLLAAGRPVQWGSGEGQVNGLVPHESWMRSVVGVRLRSQDQALGAIVLASTVEGVFGPQHIERLDAFSEHMGLAIGNARVFAMINRRAVRLAQLGELSASLSRSQDLPTVERVAVEGLAQTLAAERVALLRLESAGNLLVAAEVGKGSANLSAHAGVSAVLRGALWYVAPDAHLLVVPVRLRGETLAVIVAEARQGDGFAAEDVEHATTIAHLLAARTEQARLLAGERAARVAAEDASRHKSEFLANTTHELRTPLTGVLLALDLARDGLDAVAESQRQDLLATAQSSAQRLLETINGILDLSKIEAGRMEPQLTSVEVAEVADEVLRTLLPRAQGAGLALTLVGTGRALADRELLRRILFNLVGNGLKFTSQGAVTLRIGQVGGIIAVAVEDTGIGIDPVDQGRLFTPFTQVDGSTSRRYEGTGLGLALSRRMAGLMGGTLTLTSAGQGQGSTLTLTLPAAG